MFLSGDIYKNKMHTTDYLSIRFIWI